MEVAMSGERLARSQRFERAAQALGYDFGGEIVIGGYYVLRRIGEI
mgnify:FL=1